MQNPEMLQSYNIKDKELVSRHLNGYELLVITGDEYQNMAGRVIQFTRDRVEKELDACPWDIVGAELCNMTTAMFTANFDIESAVPGENEVSLNMCEARGCGDRKCRRYSSGQRCGSGRWSPSSVRYRRSR